MKIHKIAKNSATVKLQKNKQWFWILRILDVCLTKLKNNQSLLNKISHIFLLTTRLFTGLKILYNMFYSRTQSPVEYTKLVRFSLPPSSTFFHPSLVFHRCIHVRLRKKAHLQVARFRLSSSPSLLPFPFT